MELRKKSSISVEEEAILTTVLYSSIFSFPLTQEELWKYVISRQKIDKKAFKRSLTHLHQYLTQREHYVCLKGEEHTIAQRIANQSEVSRKQQIAQRASMLLSQIPTILFIGVSGGLAAKNVTQNDDIDLFIITKRNTMYTTRFLVLLLLQLHGLRRSRNQSQAANKICTNLFIDETELPWDFSKRDVYIAREIAQIEPLFERENMYKKFLDSNFWITAWLPNAFSEIDKAFYKQQNKSAFAYLISNILSLSLIENGMRFVQKSKMSRHRTIETVTNHHLAFHPRDYRSEVLSQLKLKMKDLGLLTKI